MSHLFWPFVAIAAVVSIGTWLVTGRVLTYVLAKNILDHPNARSAHTTPTPRGGGLAIVIMSLCATTVATMCGWIPYSVALALCGGGALVAWIGWRDDKGHVAARWRLLVHMCAAGFAVYMLGGMSHIGVGETVWHLGLIGAVLGVLAITWAINFYNFMDGIDGMASIEGATVGLCATVLLLAGGTVSIAFPACIVTCACLGFLPWNWSPAKIFMGDVCSGFLGYWFAVLAIASEKAGGLPTVAWILLLSVFVFDTTVTLIVRTMQGKRMYDAHRTHTYQYAVALGRSHATVSGTVGVITLAIGALMWWSLRRSGSFLIPAVLAACVLPAVYVGVRWKHALSMNADPQLH